MCSERPSEVVAEEMDVDGEGEAIGEGKEQTSQQKEWRWSDSTVDAVRLYHPGGDGSSASSNSVSVFSAFESQSEGEVAENEQRAAAPS